MIRNFFQGACLVTLLVSASEAQERETTSAAIQSPTVVSDHWIVHFDGPPLDLSPLRQAIRDGVDARAYALLIGDLERAARARYAPFVAHATTRGARVDEQWWIINACAVQMDSSKLDQLRSFPGVERVQPDRVAPAAFGPLIETATNSANHDADLLHQFGINGAGTTVAILDTGFDSDMNGIGRPHRTYFIDGNPANTGGPGIGGSRLLVNRMLGQVPADNTLAHGTAVAGVIAGGDWGTAAGDNGHAFGASIAGYSIAQNVLFGGGASEANMVAGWQAVVADKVALGITTANMSYHMFSDPWNPAEIALDRAAEGADILICTISGNGGASLGGTPTALNAVQLGNVLNDTHALNPGSGQGVLLNDMIVPDLCANGTQIVMPRTDNENSDVTLTGTSFASPQAAGTAAILRAAAPSMIAQEVKAVMLASAETMPGSSDQQVAGPGCGYMASDTAYLISRNPGTQHGVYKLSQVGQTFTRKVAMLKGETCNYAVSWFRQDYVNGNQWTDLDLSVKFNGAVVATSANTVENTEEFVRFTAPAAGVYNFEVVANFLDSTSLELGWATSCKTIGGQ